MHSGLLSLKKMYMGEGLCLSIFVELVLPFYLYVGFRGQTQVTRLMVRPWVASTLPFELSPQFDLFPR